MQLCKDSLLLDESTFLRRIHVDLSHAEDEERKPVAIERTLASFYQMLRCNVTLVNPQSFEYQQVEETLFSGVSDESR